MSTLHEKLAQCHPKIARGAVWCTKCDRVVYGKPSIWLATGYPMCCGYTMTIDSPKERGYGTDNIATRQREGGNP